ncbi:MAG: DNA repair protein RecO [Ignavibacteria bacterium]|nr:DNA repair protein RecO [Ignavibacteria bacterium]
MSIVKTEAFVLKSFRYGETSKIVTLFTKDFGKMNAIVKGARNFKSKLCGTLESMNHINAVIYLKDNRDLQLISSAEYKKSYSNIIADFDKLEVAYQIIEIMNKSLIEHYSNKLLF